MLSANNSTSVKVEGKEFLYFGGTNYLGLAHREELLNAAREAFAIFGFSSGASRLTSGENEMLCSLEQELAEFAGTESALVLPAGFLSNQAVVEGLDGEVDGWLISEHAHASIQSAVRLSKKPVFTIRSERLLEPTAITGRPELNACRVLGIFAEPVEPMTGELTDVGRLVAGTRSNDFLILDEAQSFGVLGDTGRGAFEHFRISSADRLIRTGTFSKAMGTYGGFILAGKSLLASIKQNSGCFAGSTSLPPPVCAATRESIRLVQQDKDSTVVSLKRNIIHLNQLLAGANLLSNAAHATPIYCLAFLDEYEHIRSELEKNHILIPSMSGYFTGKPEDSLRWTIQAGHSFAQLEKLVGILVCR